MQRMLQKSSFEAIALCIRDKSVRRLNYYYYAREADVEPR